MFIKKKREMNYEIYYEKKELVNYIELEKDNYTCSIFGNVFTIKGIIKYKITIRERGEIPIHCHQIGKYIINSLNFPSVKSEIIRHYNSKADMTIVKSKKKKPMSENINVEILDNDIINNDIINNDVINNNINKDIISNDNINNDNNDNINNDNINNDNINNDNKDNINNNISTI